MSNIVTCPICGTQAEKNTFCPTCQWFLVGSLDAVSLSPIPQSDLDAINASLKAYRESWQQGLTICSAHTSQRIQSLYIDLDTAREENARLKATNQRLERKLAEAPQEDFSGQIAALTAKLEAANAKIAQLEAHPAKADRPSLFKKSASSYSTADFEILRGVLKQYKGSDRIVTVPDGVRTIGANAFSNTDVDEVILPSSVTTIEERAFYYCTLKKIQLSSNLTTLGEAAFQNCKNLKSVELPEKIRQIPYYAFGGCTSLQSVGLPFYLQKIEHHAFSSCESIQKLVIPESVKEIGDSAFWGCKTLIRNDSLRLPSGMNNWSNERRVTGQY